MQKSEKSEGAAGETEEILEGDFNEITDVTANGSGDEDWEECEWEDLFGGRNIRNGSRFSAYCQEDNRNIQ